MPSSLDNSIVRSTLNFDPSFIDPSLAVARTPAVGAPASNSVPTYDNTFSTNARVMDRRPPQLIFEATLVAWVNETSVTPEQSEKRIIAAERIRAAHADTESRFLKLELVGLGLTTLPNCLTHLARVKCINLTNNRLESLPPLPASMTMLFASNNHMPVLPMVTQNVTNLSISNNRFTALPELPSFLKSLDVSNNFLTELPKLPRTLEHLNVFYNQLTTLPELPESLICLNIIKNLVSSLPNLDHLSNLDHLLITSNKLTHLPALPAYLKMLFASNNQLTALPALPEGLCELSVCNNNLSSLPTLPASLKYVNITNNQITNEDVNRLRLLRRRGEWHIDEQRPPISTPAAEENPPREITNNNAIQATQSVGRMADFFALSDEELSEALAIQNFYDRESPSQHGATIASDVPLQPVRPRLTAEPSAVAVQTTRAATARLIMLLRQHLPQPAPHPVRAAQPLVPIDSGMTSNPGSTKSNWWFSECEEHVDSFNKFQENITETEEYKNDNRRAALICRVDALVSAMRTSPALRAICFNIADESVTTCFDRIALGLNDMEQAHINYQAETGVFSTSQLLAIGEGLFKLHVLDGIALAKIETLISDGVEVDEIEVRLAYQTELAQRLNLPGVVQDMTFRGIADITEDDIDEAERLVRQKLGSTASVTFLAQWGPWRQAMERINPQAFEDVRKFNQPGRDALSIKPARMSEQEWIDAFNQQKALEASLFLQTTMRLTRQFIEQNPDMRNV